MIIHRDWYLEKERL